MQQKSQAVTGETTPQYNTLKGEATKLIELIEHRFGPIPDWALLQMKNAPEENLEHWMVNFAEAETIDEVFE